METDTKVKLQKPAISLDSSQINYIPNKIYTRYALSTSCNNLGYLFLGPIMTFMK
jgi:hypothetical protein